MAAFRPCHLRCMFTFGRAGLNHAVHGWSRWTFVRASSTQLPEVESQPLVLKASQFQHLFEEGPTEKVYTNTPVAALGQTQQGKLLQEWAKTVLQEKYPEIEISDPEPGRCSNGSERGVYRAEYDFLMGGRRVEIKSARMAWNSTRRRWNVQFVRVKLPFGERTESVFDDLYLVVLSPKGLHLIKHDLVTGVSTSGKSTEIDGHVIKMYGSTRTACWKDALEVILEKLCQRSGCTVVDQKPLSELGVESVLNQAVSQGQAVAGLPMSRMSKEKRGKRIEAVGLAIDGMLHPRSSFSFVTGNAGKANAPNDWVRDSVRVELKSCVLKFNRAKDLWLCQFCCIKPTHFDELWLTIYTRVGIHYYRSKSCNRLVFWKAGAATKIHGNTLAFYGPRGELDPLEAFKSIQAKMIHRGYALVAIVE